MKSRFTLLITLAVLFLSSFGAKAVIILQDDFSYADGSLTNVCVPSDKWLKFSGNNSGVPVSGGKLYIGESFSDDVASSLANAPYTSTSTTNSLIVYSSFTLNMQALAPTNK